MHKVNLAPKTENMTGCHRNLVIQQRGFYVTDS